MTTPQPDERLGKPSASGIERLVNCPGSFQAEQGMPALPEADVTRQGTKIHDALETGDDSALEETEAQVATRLVGLEQQALTDWKNSYGLQDTPIARHAEERLYVRDRRTLEIIASSKLDVHYVFGDVALIIDFKSGFKCATASERNWQLLTQAVALRDEFPEVKTFRVAIAASRLSSKLDVSEYTAADLDHAEKELLHAVWRANRENAPRVPGTWCQYCRAKADCASAASFSSLVLHGEHKDWNLQTKLAIVESVQKLKPHQLSSIFCRSKIANQVFEAVENRLKCMSEGELDKVGLRLKPGATRKIITDVPEAMELLLSVLSEDELDECLSVSFTDAVASIAAKKKIKADAAKAFTAELLSEVLETTQNKPSLEIVT